MWKGRACFISKYKKEGNGDGVCGGQVKCKAGRICFQDCEQLSQQNILSLQSRAGRDHRCAKFGTDKTRFGGGLAFLLSVSKEHDEGVELALGTFRALGFRRCGAQPVVCRQRPLQSLMFTSTICRLSMLDTQNYHHKLFISVLLSSLFPRKSRSSMS